MAALLLLAALTGPAVSLGHCLDHFEDQGTTAAHAGPDQPPAEPGGEPGSQCDLCSVLASANTAIAEAHATHPIIVASDPMRLHAPPRASLFVDPAHAPESPRAPPLV